MKKNRKVRWDTPVGIRQFHLSFFGTERSFLGEFSLFLLCTIFLFGAAFGMLQSMFEWQLLTSGMLFRILFVTVFVSGLIEVTGLFKPWLRTLSRGGILAAGTAGSLFYLLRTKQGEKVLFGLAAAGNDYLSRWNKYYGTSFRLESGDVLLLEEAVGFAAGLLCFLLVWYGRVRKRPGVAVLVPFLALVAGLLVGVTPTGLSMLVALAAVFLTNAASFRRPEFLAAPDKHGREAGKLTPFFWVPVMLATAVLCLVITRTGTSSAEETVDDGARKVKQKNKEIMEQITEWTGWQEVNVAKSVERAVRNFLERKEIDTGNIPESNYAKLDNETPEYEEVTVLKVALEKKLSSGAYFIGFYADAYEDGVWDTDVKKFEKICEKAGYNPDYVADSLITLGADRVAQHYGKDSLSEFSYRGINGWMYYAKANRIKAYMPYFAEVTAEGVQTEGDSRYIKEKSLTKVPFALWNYDVDELIGVMFRGTETDSAWEKEAWEQWYETYVTQAYLTVPEDMTQVKAVAEEIRNWERDFFRIEGRFSVNFDRINKAYQVADWMRRNTTYSLELPDLPKGSDPVEFFLGTSRQGYCMHYAGASVLILRELGVPARYVSGYVAGSFNYNTESRMYEAVVKDSAAHAWVEIYLEGVGWIPVEVTKGYSVMPSGTQSYVQTETGAYRVVKENWPEDKDEYGNSFFWHHTLPFVTPAPTPTPDPSVTPSGTQGGNSSSQEGGGSSVSQVGGATTPAPTGGATPAAQEEEKRKDETKVDLSVNPVVLLLALPVVGIFLGVIVPLSDFFRKKKGDADERKLLRKMKRFGNRQKIKLLNQRLYRKLRGKGKIYQRFPRDEEYDEVLRKYSAVLSREERERYMHLVKAAAFSYNEFTDEEVEFCKQVYHKVLYERAKEDDRE